MLSDTSPVLIVTLFRSLNYGAFLQAYALQEALRSKGLSPAFLDVYGPSQSLRRYFALLKPKDLSPAGMAFSLRKLQAFRSVADRLKVVTAADAVNARAAFLGSDEIWSLVNTSFVSAPEFFGINLATPYKFSYAPSAGNTSSEHQRAAPEKYAALDALELISVRDPGTGELVREALPAREAVQVLDPAFLHDFAEVPAEPVESDPFVLVYSYRMPAARIREVKDYAQRHALKLVSPGFHNAWCDSTVACDPFQFLQLIRQANCVVTDTFHGSVFAIKYRKNFVSYTADKYKVKSLLESLSMGAASICDGDIAGMDVIETDYTALEPILSKQLSISYQFLDRCIQIMA